MDVDGGAFECASAGEETRLLEETLRAVGPVALRYFGGPVREWTKDDASPVSEADLAVDAALREALAAARPDHGWLSEETAREPGRCGRIFVVDPIDGTRAFLAGETAWALSVAVIEEGRPIAAALFAPAREEMFTATRGRGARRNGVALSVHDGPLRDTTVAAPRAVFDRAGIAAAGAQRARYVPSLALRLASVAAGTIGAVVTKGGAHHWDLAAADLIVTEAGGRLLDLAGEAPRYDGAETRHGPVVAGPPERAGALLTLAGDHFAHAA